MNPCGFSIDFLLLYHFPQINHPHARHVANVRLEAAMMASSPLNPCD